MSRILLCWELGANLGHVALIRSLAASLRTLGHDCLFAVQNVAAAEAFGLAELGPVFQAPRFGTGAKRPVRVQISYASLLHNTGFDDVSAIVAVLRAWRQLLGTLRVDALIAEHAPASLLAARSLGLPRAAVGTSFTVPPLRRPFPLFQPQLQVDPAVLEHNEQEVLGLLNRALAQLGLAPLDHLQDLFAGADTRIFGYPELDAYGPGARAPELFAGAPDHARGEDPAWPQATGPRLFAYLRPYAHLDAVLCALKASRVNALVRVADADPSMLHRYARPGLRLVTTPLHLRHAAERCDVMLHYAPAGTTTEMLLAGKPGLLLPTDVEKLLVARCAVALGAALVPQAQDEAAISEALERLLSDTRLRQAAGNFADRYRGQDRGSIGARYATAFSAGL